MGRLEGVATVHVSLQDNVVTIVPAGPIDLAAIPSEIRRVGFVPEDFEAEAVGMLTEGSFRPDGWPVFPAAATTTGRAHVHARIDVSTDPPTWEIESATPAP